MKKIVLTPPGTVISTAQVTSDHYYGLYGPNREKKYFIFRQNGKYGVMTLHNNPISVGEARFDSLANLLEWWLKTYHQSGAFEFNTSKELLNWLAN